MTHFFTVVLYQPILNLLVWVYSVTGHDLGIAIIIITILIKAILYPFSRQALRGQKALQELQPKINAVREQYKDNKEKQAQELMQLYKQEKINPLSSCLPLLLQIPFLIAVFKVFSLGLASGELSLLYSFIPNPGHLNTLMFGIFDLSKPNIVLAILAGAAQFWQAKMLITTQPPKDIPGSKDESMAAIMNKQMLYLMPVMTAIIGFRLPAGLSLYWVVMTLATVAQQKMIFRTPKEPTPSTPVLPPASV